MQACRDSKNLVEICRTEGRAEAPTRLNASILLIKLALARHSVDNVSVVVVDLRRSGLHLIVKSNLSHSISDFTTTFVIKWAKLFFSCHIFIYFLILFAFGCEFCNYMCEFTHLFLDFTSRIYTPKNFVCEFMKRGVNSTK